MALKETSYLCVVSCIFIILLLPTSYVSCANVTNEDSFNKDWIFFEEHLDLDYEGMMSVKQAVKNKDIKKATYEYVKYLKNRKTPIWFFDSKDIRQYRDTLYNVEEANSIVSNNIVVCNIPYEFGEEIIWDINPTTPYYNEWTWQLNRHEFWDILGKAYWATGDEKYAKAFVSQLKSWINNRPRQEKNYNGEYSSWRTIDTAIRMWSSWPNAFYRFLYSESFDDRSILMMAESIYEQGEHLKRHPSKGGNWMATELCGLYYVSLLFPEFKDAKEWNSYATKNLKIELQSSFYPDGSQTQLTPGYHGIILEHFRRVYRLASLNKKTIFTDNLSSFESLYEYYLKIQTPDGKMPALNDSRWENTANYLNEGYSIFNERKDFLYGASLGENGSEPSFTSVWMPWAGWYIMRSGWERNSHYSIFEVGPYSTGHSHEDKLSLILYGFGERLLTECGLYPYNSTEWRIYSLSARGHNVTRIDGMDQNREAKSDIPGIRRISKPLKNRWITNDNFDFGEGWYNEGFGKNCELMVDQYRSLLFIKGLGWLMIDFFNPEDDTSHSYESWFHLEAVDAIVLDNKSIVTVAPHHSTLQIIPLNKQGLTANVIKGQEEPEVQGWVHNADSGYSITSVPTAIYNRKAKGILIEPYLFLPVKKDEKPHSSTIVRTGKNNYLIFFDDKSYLKIRIKTNKNKLKSLYYEWYDVTSRNLQKMKVL